MYLKPVKQDLLDYYAWLQENDIQSEWLFPSTTHQDRYLSDLRNPLSQKNTAIIKWYNKKVHWRPPMHKYTLLGADSFWRRSFTRLAGGVWQYTRIRAILLNLSAQLLNIIFH